MTHDINRAPEVAVVVCDPFSGEQESARGEHASSSANTILTPIRDVMADARDATTRLRTAFCDVGPDVPGGGAA